MVAAMEKACGHEIPVEMAERREGDTEAVWAATDLAEKVLSWKARFTVEDMCRDQWNWAKRFPRGYEETVQLMRPWTILPRDKSFDVLTGTRYSQAERAAEAAIAAVESGDADAASQPLAPVTEAVTPVTTADEGILSNTTTAAAEKRNGIFREVHEVDANGLDGVQLGGRNGIAVRNGKVSGVKAAVVPANSSPAGKAACAAARG